MAFLVVYSVQAGEEMDRHGLVKGWERGGDDATLLIQQVHFVSISSLVMSSI